MTSELIEKLHQIDGEGTLLLLHEPIHIFKVFFIDDYKFLRTKSQLTCLEFEATAKLIKFGHPAITECLDSFWYDKLLRKNEQSFNTWFKVMFYYKLIMPSSNDLYLGWFNFTVFASISDICAIPSKLQE